MSEYEYYIEFYLFNMDEFLRVRRKYNLITRQRYIDWMKKVKG